jgi:hypothetical protein
MNRNKRLAAVALLALLGFGPLAQGQSQALWVNRYNSPKSGDDLVQGMAVDGAGNVFVTGSSVNTNQDILTIKFSPTGARLWTDIYNGPANGQDAAVAIAVDGSGNAYVTGYSQVTNTGSVFEYVTIKYSPEGNRLWMARYQFQTNLSSLATALAVDLQGNVVVTGQSQAPDTGVDYATIKYDSDGHGLWTNRFNGLGYATDRATAIALDDSGHVYVTGESYSGYEAGPDYATIKYDAQGNGVWTNRFNGPGGATDSPVALAADSDGNVYVTGTSWGRLTYHDYATVKYDAAGRQLWVARYNGPADYFDLARALAVDAMGNVYVTGESRYVGSQSHYATIKYNPNGQQLWAARYPGLGSGQNQANAIAVDAAGNVYVTGESDGNYATVKHDADGNRLWVARYHTSDWDTGVAVAADLAGFVYVAGDASRSEYDDLDCVVIKYGQMETPGLPVITSEPQGQVVAGGAEVSLMVNVSSPTPLRYQWYQDGNPIAGATQAGLTLADVRWEDSGSYWVSASNEVGAVVSPEARVWVQVAPRFTLHPQSHYSGTGIPTTLSGQAVGTPPLGYQWQHNGTNLTDANSTHLMLDGVSPEAAGNYALIATNAFGRATSEVAAVTLELSAPLNAWAAQAISTNLYNLRGNYHDQDGYVVVGNSGAIFTSGPGTNWIPRHSGTDQNLHIVTRADGLYVAAGSDGALLTSIDLDTWTPRGTPTSEPLFGLASDETICVAVGDGGTVLTSSDGQGWTLQSSGTTADLHGLTFGQGLFAAVGKNGLILTSADGSHWHRQTNGLDGPVPALDLKAVVWGSCMFVVVGEQGTVLTSPDGTNWTRQLIETTEDLNGVAYGEGVFTLVGDGESGPGVIFSALEGGRWVLRKSGTNKNLRGVAWGQGEFLAVGNDSTIVRSGLIPKPTLVPIAFLPGAGMNFQVRDEIIRPCRIQASSNLNTWEDLFSVGAWPLDTNLVDTAAHILPFRFYRMVSP